MNQTSRFDKTYAYNTLVDYAGSKETFIMSFAWDLIISWPLFTRYDHLDTFVLPTKIETCYQWN